MSCMMYVSTIEHHHYIRAIHRRTSIEKGPHLGLIWRAIHQLGCRTEIFSWFVRSTADKREMQKYSARKREMQKYSAHNRKIQKYSAHKAKNAVHTRKMQHMRLEYSRSKSEPDVGSSAGVGCGVDSRCWLGGAAAGRPLGRSLARSLLWAGYPRRGTKKRSSARV